MLKQVYKIDENGFYLEPVLVEEKLLEEEELDSYLIKIPFPEGLYRPKWDFKQEKWIETITEAEKEELKNAAPSNEIETLKERIELMQKVLDELILGGAL
ncbi:hypothetical protein [Aeribacillus pallidus]|jgi:hypothetical protein|uniref:hypothetical protein n=1 Tax=Aeribacillus pallidus TaxID=33936 RepID=UPI000E34E3FA|nr:hypothetical protein [Aeribacillus pallidus]